VLADGVEAWAFACSGLEPFDGGRDLIGGGGRTDEPAVDNRDTGMITCVDSVDRQADDALQGGLRIRFVKQGAGDVSECFRQLDLRFVGHDTTLSTEWTMARLVPLSLHSGLTTPARRCS
jgi:hypothetical protein